MKLISALFLILAPLSIIPIASATTHDAARVTEGIQVTESGNDDKNLRGPVEQVDEGRKLWYSSPSKGSKSSKSKGKGKGSKSSKSRF